LTSELKIKINRANSRASTGPRTRHGRARAARNALRHGLSLPVCSDPVLSAQVEELAREIAGEDADQEMQEAARLIAEAQIDVHRVRQMRHQLLTAALRNPHYDSRVKLRAKARLLERLLLQPNVPEILKTALTNLVLSAPQGDDKFALFLAQEAKRLHALDRYERRALSRRNRAVQEFDCAIACKYLNPNSNNP
jgi:hypothetical protein